MPPATSERRPGAFRSFGPSAIALVVALAACSEPDLAEPTPEIAAQLTTTTSEPAAAVIAGAGSGEATTSTLPGDGRAVIVGRGDRPGDRLLAEAAADALGVLGYDVPDPSLFPLDGRAATVAIGEGDVDVWVGRWTPLDDLVDPVGTDGASATARLLDLGVVAEAVVGFTVAPPAATEAEVDAELPTLWALLTEPSVAVAHDHDGDGRPELWGCRTGSSCAAWIEQLAPLLPAEAGFEADVDDLVQFDDGALVVDPATPRVVFAIGSEQSAEAAVGDPDLELGPGWLASGAPAEAVTTTTAGDGIAQAPGPLAVEVRVVVGTEWAETEPAAVAALGALEIDADAYRASWPG